MPALEVPESFGGDFAHSQTVKTAALTPEYKYGQLPGDQYIRVLTLGPGGIDDPLRGTLHVVHIDSAGSYEPLSYVWGNAEVCHHIDLEDGPGESRLGLTQSIGDALQRVRHPDRARRLWADQICINQKNMEERSQQVQFMNRIYKNASLVLVWLGPADHAVTEFVSKLIDELKEIFGDQAKRQKFHIEHTEKLREQSRARWDPLDHLTALPWFSRTWISQEIGTQAPATLFWGEARIDWTTLHKVCEDLTDYHHLRSRFNIRTSDIKYLFQRFIEPSEDNYHANRFSFMYELHRARGLKVTDPRDRVFAMLGHYSNAKLTELEADYTKTVAQVYRDVAERSLRGDASLIALAAVQHMHLPSSTEGPEQRDGRAPPIDNDTLPSWAPDWRTYQSFILSEPINPHCAHGMRPPKLTIKGLKLSISGVQIDVVESCSKPLEAKAFHLNPFSPSSYSQSRTELPVEHLWHSICAKQQFDLRETYLTGGPALFAYMQTLSNGCVQIATRHGRPYHAIPDSEWLAQEAEYLVKALDPQPSSTSPSTAAIAPALREIAKGGGGDDRWSRAANGASKNRVFARTRRGYFLLGASVLQAGDVVCVLFGGKMPFCLRPWGKGDGGGGGSYLLVGECYVHGLMRGEAMEALERGELAERVFDIV